MGLVNGERPPALERLNLIAYPFGRPSSLGYPGPGPEVRYWADTFDWSRLKYFKVSDPSFALLLMPNLIALQEADIGEHDVQGSQDSETLVQFYLEVPAKLTKITVPNLDCITMEGIIRHGAVLKELQIHQCEQYWRKWSETAPSDSSLVQIRDACPLLEDLQINVARSDGVWRSSTLDILATFPRLRRLTIWFELGVATEDGCKNKTTQEDRKDGAVLPKVTFAFVKWLFEYLRTAALLQRQLQQSSSPRLEELRIYSGSPPPIGFGHPSRMAFWPEHNSMEFLCRIAVRDDEAAQGRFTCECLGLDNQQVNEVLRGEREEIEDQSELKDNPMQYMWDLGQLAVARDGPMGRDEWLAHGI